MRMPWSGEISAVRSSGAVNRPSRVVGVDRDCVIGFSWSPEDLLRADNHGRNPAWSRPAAPGLTWAHQHAIFPDTALAHPAGRSATRGRVDRMQDRPIHTPPPVESRRPDLR